MGVGYSNVAIKDNHLYTMGHKGRENYIYCLDAETGHEIWKYTFQSSHDVMSTPIVDGNRIYGLGKNGKIYCLKTKNGKLLWEKDLWQDFNAQVPSYGWATSPIVAPSVWSSRHCARASILVMRQVKEG